MKTNTSVQAVVRFFILKIWVLAIIVMNSSVFGQAQIVSPTEWYGTPPDELILEVEYRNVDKETIGDGDLWIFGYAGLSTPAKFIGFTDKEGAIERKPEEWNDFGISGEFIFGKSLLAQYRIPRPINNTIPWSDDYNQRIAVLLEPEQVRSSWGQWIAPAHLGFLHVKFGQEKPPVRPSDIDLSIRWNGEGYEAHVNVFFDKATKYVSKWHELKQNGNKFSVELEFAERSSIGINELPAPNRRRFELPSLNAGNYEFFVTHQGESLKKDSFEVDGLEGIETEIELRSEENEEGQKFLKGSIKFNDPYIVISDPGKVELVSNPLNDQIPGINLPQILEIKLKAERVTFVKEPEHQAFDLEYLLPEIEDGIYQVDFWVNSQLQDQLRVRIPTPDRPVAPSIISFTARPQRVRLGQPVTLEWDVENADSLNISPDVGRVEGNKVVVFPSLNSHLPDPLFGEIVDELLSNESVIVGTKSEWKYFDENMKPDGDWKVLNFSDDEWKTGRAPLGYGDGDENTVISFGEDEKNKSMTAYFRKSFNLKQVDDPENDPVLLYLHRDDGAVVYLNGVEIVRSNMVPGTINHDTPALSTAVNDGNSNPQFFPVDHDLLKTGDNVIAVEVHQANPRSSDLSFDLAMFRMSDMPLIDVPEGEFEVQYTLTAGNNFTRAAKTVSVTVISDEVEPQHTANIEFQKTENGHMVMVFVEPKPSFQIIHWGELNREGNSFNVEVELVDYRKLGAEDENGNINIPAPEPLENTYELGSLDDGKYTFSISDGQNIFAKAELKVGLEDNKNDSISGIEVEAAPIVEIVDQYSFQVLYDFEEGIDINSLGDDDIILRPWLKNGLTALRIKELSAGFIKVVTHDSGEVWAQYAVKFPEGYINQLNTFQFEILLNNGGVVNGGGGKVQGGRIGLVDVSIPIIEPEVPFGFAEAGPVLRSQNEAEIFVFVESPIPLDTSSLETGSIRVVRYKADSGEDVVAIPVLVEEPQREKDVFHIESVFHSGVPDGGWNSEHNGIWEIELIEGGLVYLDGSPFPRMQLGELEIKISETKVPEDEFSVSLNTYKEEDEQGVELNILFPPNDRRQVMDWGEPMEIDGGGFEIHANSSIRDTLDALPLKQSHRYTIIGEAIDPDNQEIPFKTEEVSGLDIKEPGQIVINDEVSWFEWTSEQLGDIEIALQPPVDFKTRTLIGVFSGEKPIGFGIQIQEIEQRNNKIKVEYVETIPGILPEEPQPTFPSHWVSIPKTSLEISFDGGIIAFPSPPPAGIASRIEPQHIEIFPQPRVIPVVWFLDGVALAKTALIVKSDPDGKIHPIDTQINVEKKNSNEVQISITADFTQTGRNIILDSWDESEVDGNLIALNLNVNESDAVDGILTPGVPPVFSHTYVFEALRPGHYLVRFSVNDDVVAVENLLVGGEHPFFDWLEEHLKRLDDMPTGSERGPIDIRDADGDGLSDWYEWTFNTDPVVETKSSPVKPGILERDGEMHFTFDFDFRGHLNDSSFIIEGSDDLKTWKVIDSSCTVLEQKANSDGSQHFSLCMDQSVDQVPLKFVRISVKNSPNP